MDSMQSTRQTYDRLTFGGVVDVTGTLSAAVHRGVERIQAVSAITGLDDEVLQARLVARLYSQSDAQTNANSRSEN